MDAFTLGIVIFSMTVLMVYLLRVPAVWAGWVDIPRGHKQHTGQVPLVGGLAMFLTLLLAAQLNPTAWSSHHGGLILGAVVLLVTGMLDDRFDLSPGVKFVAQAMAASCLLWGGGPQLVNLGNLLGSGDLGIGVAAVPLTVFAVMGLVNAINFSDGLDGLAGGLALISLTAFALVASLIGQSQTLTLLVACLAALGGFWVFNMRFHDRLRAMVFMGNAGSMLVGFALAWFSLDLTQGVQPALSPVYALWFLALPLIETVSLIRRRLARGRHPFQAGRDHLHHALLRAGLSHAGAVWAILLGHALLAGIGFVGWRVGAADSPMFAAFLLTFMVYHAAAMNGWKIVAWTKVWLDKNRPNRLQ